MPPDNYCFATLPAWAGRAFGTSDWVRVTQDHINTFAHATGDHQWIHVDAERCARESPFGGPIAHGFLSLSLLARLLMDMGLIPDGASRAINAGVNNVWFRQPVRVDQRVRAQVRIGEVQAQGAGRYLLVAHCVLDIAGQADPALSGDITVMLFA